MYDVLVNNADCSYVLAMGDGHRYGVDHGLTFHSEHKLRGELGRGLAELLTAEEVASLARAAPDCGSAERFPARSGETPAVP